MVAALIRDRWEGHTVMLAWGFLEQGGKALATRAVEGLPDRDKSVPDHLIIDPLSALDMDGFQL
jgi:hypothetical protein